MGAFRLRDGYGFMLVGDSRGCVTVLVTVVWVYNHN